MITKNLWGSDKLRIFVRRQLKILLNEVDIDCS